VKKKSPQSSSSSVVEEVKKVLHKIPDLEKQVKVRGEFIYMDIGIIKSGKQGLEVSFASNANTTQVAMVTRELAARYALKITPPYYDAVDGTHHVGQEGERAYRRDLEDSFMKKVSREAISEVIFREYESDTVH